MCARLTRRLINAERPLLAAHGLTMWQYIVLSELVGGPVQNQLALARAIAYDKTRLASLLEDLEADRLISRRPDPADRRGRVVSLTDVGKRRQAAAAKAIREMEDALLEPLDESARIGLFEALTELSGRHAEDHPQPSS